LENLIILFIHLNQILYPLSLQRPQAKIPHNDDIFGGGGVVVVCLLLFCLFVFGVFFSEYHFMNRAAWFIDSNFK
jgi:hypothetical protein